MGGDHGLPVTLAACLDFLKRDSLASLLLVGRESDIRSAPAFAALQASSRAHVIHAPEVVEMGDPPAVALRSKRQSSMRLAFEQVGLGHAHGAVSAGNTGALMAISRNVLKTIEGIDRPAIATFIPNRSGSSTLMLDLGANVDCTAEHLAQFGLMGSALSTAMGVLQPRVALLNVGEEVIKGNELVKQAAEQLRQMPLHFIGNVEGNDVFKGAADVVVCDGFVGNVALKTSEGVAQMLGAFLKEEFRRGLFSRLAALIASPVLRAFVKRVDHRRYNGAVLLGLRGVVVKSHGSADAYGFRHALERAAEAARHRLVQRISESLAERPEFLRPSES
jgi:glycerol-3-phosphate acyltransferase PlsX